MTKKKSGLVNKVAARTRKILIDLKKAVTKLLIQNTKRVKIKILRMSCNVKSNIILVLFF
jgi:hypothetical protein